MRNCRATSARRRTDSLYSAAYSSQILQDNIKPHLVTPASTVSIKLSNWPKQIPALSLPSLLSSSLIPRLYSNSEVCFYLICCLQQVKFNQDSLCWLNSPLITSNCPWSTLHFCGRRVKRRWGQWLENAPCLSLWIEDEAPEEARTSETKHSGPSRCCSLANE